MHVGLYDDNPRARELVWIMLANRAPRGLASLYVQANLFTRSKPDGFMQNGRPVAGQSPGIRSLHSSNCFTSGSRATVAATSPASCSPTA